MADQLLAGIPPVLDNNGFVLAGGTVTFYETGTTTLVDIWANVAGTIPLSNPITLDAAGRPESQVFYTGGVSVKEVIHDASGATLYTIDPSPRFAVSEAAASNTTFAPTAANPSTNVQEAINFISEPLDEAFTFSPNLISTTNRIAINNSDLVGQDGLVIRNSGLSAVRFSYAGAAEGADFLINYNGSGVDDILISSDGSMKLGANLTTSQVQTVVNNNIPMQINRTGNVGTMIAFQSDGVGVGGISQNGSVTSYNTSSDYRLKENVDTIEGGLDIVNALRPVTYTYKGTDIWMDGFLAHEVQGLLPNAVQGDLDGEDMQSMDYSLITPILTKAVQEMSAQLKTAMARIAVLESLSE